MALQGFQACKEKFSLDVATAPVLLHIRLPILFVALCQTGSAASFKSKYLNSARGVYKCVLYDFQVL